MVDIAAISAALSSVKLAGEMTKGLVGLRDERQFNTRAGEIAKELAEARSLVAEAQTAMLDLLGRVRDLEAKLAEKEAWAAEKTRYEMIEFDPGRIVYRVKETMRAEEPVHHLCPACFQQGQKSIMQAECFYGTVRLKCGACELDVSTNMKEPFSL